MRPTQDITTTVSTRYGRDESVTETHPAFGVAVLTRSMNGQGSTLFQSDIKNNSTITLSIHRAVRDRSLHNDHVQPREEIIEIEMSAGQWGELVSAIGIGSGVPVTIRRTETDGMIPELPYTPRVRESLNEVEGAVAKLVAEANESAEALAETIESKAGIRATREALRKHQLNLAHMTSNAKFAATSLQEAAEKMVSNAKSDIETAALHAARLVTPDAQAHIAALGDPASIEE